MSGLGFLFFAIGTMLGASMRWALGVLLNATFSPIPPGTLTANLIAGYVVGVGVGVFSQIPTLGPEWRLLVITGFCGGLSTFSTFSAEIASLLQQARFGAMAAAIGLHVGGSLLATLGGIASARWVITATSGVQS